MRGVRGFFRTASSDRLTKKTPLGMHELTCCVFMPHISWLRTMSRGGLAMRWAVRVGWAACPGGCRGKTPVGCREGGRLWTPRKSLGDQWPHWCRAQKKAAHWHDVILHMSTFITATQWGVQKCKTCLVYQSLPLFDAPRIWYCKQCSAGAMQFNECRVQIQFHLTYCYHDKSRADIWSKLVFIKQFKFNAVWF